MGKLIEINFNKAVIDNYLSESYEEIEKAFDAWYKRGLRKNKVIFTLVVLPIILIGFVSFYVS